MKESTSCLFGNQTHMCVRRFTGEEFKPEYPTDGAEASIEYCGLGLHTEVGRRR